MKKISLVISLFLLANCAPPHISISVPSEFRPYVDSFKSLYGVNDSIKIVKADLPGNTLGQCDLYWSKITIDTETWDNALDFEKESLMYHELGHCLLYREHVSDIDEDGCPTSIMYPTNYVNYCYEQKRETYLKELSQKRNTLLITFVGIDDENSTW